MAGRKKTQFTDEMNQLIKDSIFEGKSLQEIVDELMNEFGLKTTIPTLTNHIKSLGIKRENNKTGKRADISYDELMLCFCQYMSISMMANKFNCRNDKIYDAIKRYDITPAVVKEYRDKKYFSNLSEKERDLRSLKKEYGDRVIEEIINTFKTFGIQDEITIQRDALIETPDMSVMIDFYIPEINRGYVCNNSDNIVEENKTLIQCQCCNRINKGCKTTVKVIGWDDVHINKYDKFGDGEGIFEDEVNYIIDNVPSVKEYTYEGLYIHPYMMDFDIDERRFNFDTTGVRLAKEIISIYRKGSVLKKVDYKTNDLVGCEVVAPSDAKKEFDEFMNEVCGEGWDKEISFKDPLKRF